jgi:hypothetical protein
MRSTAEVNLTKNGGCPLSSSHYGALLITRHMESFPCFWVVKIDLQPQATLAGIAERLRKGVVRQQPLTLKLAIDPVEESLHPWLAVSQSMLSFALTGEVLLPDLILDPVELSDLLEGFLHRLRIGLQGLKERSTAMNPTWAWVISSFFAYFA